MRVKHLFAGLLMGVITSWMIVGGYVLGVGYAMEHVGRSCRLRGYVTTGLMDGFVLVGLAVSAVLVIAPIVESWKHKGVPEVGDWGAHMFVILVWLMVGNGLVFLLAALWVGCGVWNLFK